MDYTDERVIRIDASPTPKVAHFSGVSDPGSMQGLFQTAKSDRTSYALERHNVAALASEVKNYLGPNSGRE